MKASENKLRWWQIILLAPLVVAVIPLALVVVAAYFSASALLYPAIWLLWCSRGKDVLFVYSESPVWRDYLEAHVLPKIAERAIVLNWTERKQWGTTLASLAFSHFGGSRQFNPLGVVFRPFRRARVFRFWLPFRDFKHGRSEPLTKIQMEFFDALRKN